MGSSSNTPEEFSTIDLDNNDTTTNDINMAQEFSSVRLSEDKDTTDNTKDQVHSSGSAKHNAISHHPHDLSMSVATDRTASMTADHLLDELSDATATQHGSAPGTFPLEISRSTSSKTSNASIGNGVPSSSPAVPEKEWVDNSRMTYQYDQFFEEVSLDLPRDTQQPFDATAAAAANATATTTTTSPTASKLLKFMPRRPTADQKPPNLSITTADVSGPFYSISDVLSDSPSTNATAAAAAAAAAVAATSSSTNNKDDPTSQQRGARRNVYERDVIVTSGGSSARAIKRRSRQVDE